MKISLFKKLTVFAVVAAMLVAVFAASAVAASTKISVHAVNSYPDYNGVIAWSTTESNNVESVYAKYVSGLSAWNGYDYIFLYWSHVYLTQTKTAGVYEVQATSAPQSQDYASWEINAKSLVLSCYSDATDTASRNALLALKVGDRLTLKGDILDKTGDSYKLDSAYLTDGSSGNDTPTVTPSGDSISVHAINKYDADHTQGVFVWASRSATKVDYIQNSAWDGVTPIFTYWKHVLLTAKNGSYTVTAVSESGSNDYASWTVDSTHIVLSAWNECTTAGARVLFGLSKGATLGAVGSLGAGTNFTVGGKGVAEIPSAPAEDSSAVESEEPADESSPDEASDDEASADEVSADEVSAEDASADEPSAEDGSVKAEPSADDDSESDSESGSTALIVIIASAVVVLCAIVATVLVIKKRRK